MKSYRLASMTVSAAFLVGLTGSSFGQNIISNGSFESEPSSVVTQTYGDLEYDPAPDGWTFGGSNSHTDSYSRSNADGTRPQDASNSNAYVDAEDGQWYISFGAYGPGTPAGNMYDRLSQQVQTVANTSYTLTYSLYELGGAGSATTGDYFNVTWDGQVVSGTQVTDNQASSMGWITEQAIIMGDGSTHSISFNGWSKGHWVNLDNVSLTAQSVPEPSSFAALGIGLLGFFIKRRK